jgi:hypothetical protein
MRSFFRSLEARRVRYLLISGQASVLYGAATFSEDVDLWLAADTANLEVFIGALRSARARVYRLTPPLTLRNLRRGHGFHFVLPQPGAAEAYLDVMGRPPRVGSFASAARRAQHMTSDWGMLPVVSIEDLVELKKTRRLADYDVISNLVRVRVEASKRMNRSLLRWSLENSFRIDDACELLDRFPEAREIAASLQRDWVRALGALYVGGRLRDRGAGQVQELLAREVARLQRRDTAYWSSIIDELRQMRRLGRLLPDGRELDQSFPRRSGR